MPIVKLQEDDSVENRDRINHLLKLINQQVKLLSGNDLIFMKKYLEKLVTY